MATRLKLNRVKFLEACRAALAVARQDVAQAQAELDKYDWRKEATSRVQELGKLLKDPTSTEEVFTDALYEAAREFKRNDLEYHVQKAEKRADQIEDMVNLAEIEVGDEIAVSTSDSFVQSILRQAKREGA